jgi:hypothetical protein
VDDKHANRSAGKGKIQIILHAITENSPLCKLDKNGRPVDILEWNKDTPHAPKDLVDGSLTCDNPVIPCGWQLVNPATTMTT